MAKSWKVTAKELAILKLLVEHHGQVLSRAQILDHVWAEHEDPPFDRVVDVYIKQLRKNYCWIVSLLLKMSDTSWS